MLYDVKKVVARQAYCKVDTQALAAPGVSPHKK